MSNSELRNLLHGLPERVLKWNFSDRWLTEVSQELDCENGNAVGRAHTKLCNTLLQRTLAHFRNSSFCNTLDSQAIEDVVMSHFQKKLESFDPLKKTYEQSFLRFVLGRELYKKIRKSKKNHSQHISSDNTNTNRVFRKSQETFFDEILSLDGEETIISFIKNISIIEGKEFSTYSIDVLKKKVARSYDRTISEEDTLYSTVLNFSTYKKVCNYME